MKTYRTAIIGMRGIGGAPAQASANPVLGQIVPASHTANYAYLPQTELVAVCDLVPDLLESFRRDFGETLPNVKTYADYREMLAKERIDILSVATSDHVHAQMTIDGVADRRERHPLREAHRNHVGRCGPDDRNVRAGRRPLDDPSQPALGTRTATGARADPLR